MANHYNFYGKVVFTQIYGKSVEEAKEEKQKEKEEKKKEKEEKQKEKEEKQKVEQKPELKNPKAEQQKKPAEPKNPPLKPQDLVRPASQRSLLRPVPGRSLLRPVSQRSLLKPASERSLPPPSTETPSKAVAEQLSLCNISSPPDAAVGQNWLFGEDEPLTSGCTPAKRPRCAVARSPPAVRQLTFESSPPSPESPPPRPMLPVVLAISPNGHLRCPKCRQMHISAIQLTEHIRTCDHFAKPHECAFCTYRSSKEKGAEAHQAQCRQNPDVINRMQTNRVYTCVYCSRTFSSQGPLANHRKKCPARRSMQPPRPPSK